MAKYDYKRIAELYLSGMTCLEISKSEGCSLGTLSGILKRQGVQLRPRLKGADHPQYKNGKYKNHDNYIILTDGHVREHRVVIEAHVNRKLEHWEHVHHINGCKSDNDITNLALMATREHTRFHNFLCNCGLDVNRENLEKFCLKEDGYTFRFTKEQLIGLGIPNTIKPTRKKKCRIVECTNLVYGHKLCNKHYQREKAIERGYWKSGGGKKRKRVSKVYFKEIK